MAGGGIRLVSPDPVRLGPRSATIRPGDADTGHHRLEVRGTPGLPGGQHQRQGPLPVLARQVQWGRQPAAGAAQPVIARLRCAPAGRLALGMRLPTDAGCVLMRGMTVESTLTGQSSSPASSALACNTARMHVQTPSRTRPQGPAHLARQTPRADSLVWHPSARHWGAPVHFSRARLPNSPGKPAKAPRPT